MDRTYRRDLSRKRDGHGDGRLAALDRTLEVVAVELAQLLAQIGRGLDQLDEAVLDQQVHVGALFDVLVQDTGRFDGEVLAPVSYTTHYHQFSRHPLSDDTVTTTLSLRFDD